MDNSKVYTLRFDITIIVDVLLYFKIKDIIPTVISFHLTVDTIPLFIQHLHLTVVTLPLHSSFFTQQLTLFIQHLHLTLKVCYPMVDHTYPMLPYGTLCYPMVPYATLWYPMLPYSTLSNNIHRNNTNIHRRKSTIGRIY